MGGGSLSVSIRGGASVVEESKTEGTPESMVTPLGLSDEEQPKVTSTYFPTLKYKTALMESWKSRNRCAEEGC